MLTELQAHRLLDTLCCELGFCLPPEDWQRLTEDPPASVSAFTDAVWLAEGLELPTADRHLYRQVRDIVADAFQRAESTPDEPTS